MGVGSSERASVIPLPADLIAMGRLGQKSGAGFRKYEPKGSRGVPDPEVEPLLQRHRLPGAPSDQAILIDRLFLPMLLEAIRVLDDRVVTDPAVVDRGVVLGLGFPASRGGLFGWCDNEGEARSWIAWPDTRRWADGSNRVRRSTGWSGRGAFLQDPQALNSASRPVLFGSRKLAVLHNQAL